MHREIAYERSENATRAYGTRLFALQICHLLETQATLNEAFFRFIGHLIKQELLIYPRKRRRSTRKSALQPPDELARVSHLRPVGTAV